MAETLPLLYNKFHREIGSADGKNTKIYPKQNLGAHFFLSPNILYEIEKVFNSKIAAVFLPKRDQLSAGIGGEIVP